jgi:negative regulator of replication initiation
MSFRKFIFNKLVISIGYVAINLFLGLKSNASSSALTAFDERARIQAEVEAYRLNPKPGVNINEHNLAVKKLTRDRLIPAQIKAQERLNNLTLELMNPKTYSLKSKSSSGRALASDTKNERRALKSEVKIDPKSVPKIYRFGQKKK